MGHHRFKAKRIVAAGDQCLRNGPRTRLAVKVLRFQPCAQPRVGDLRLPVPEARIEVALYLQMIERELNYVGLLWKIASDISGANRHTGVLVTF